MSCIIDTRNSAADLRKTFEFYDNDDSGLIDAEDLIELADELDSDLTEK